MFRTSVLLFFILMIGISPNVGCKKPKSDSDSSGGRGGAYDPRNDPLVNPASLLQPPPEDRSKVDDEQTLLLHLGGSPSTLNPIFGSSAQDQMVNSMLYTGLFTFDRNLMINLNDELVQSIDESEDHTEYTIKMKSGHSWQDGHPLTAHDVVFSWAVMCDSKVPVSYRGETVKIARCEARDDYTVYMQMKKPLSIGWWALSFSIIPKHVYEKHRAEFPDLKTGDYYNRVNRSPVGSGSYKLVEWVENDKLIFERWENYEGEKPYFKKIICKIVPDMNIALLNLMKGNVDMIKDLSADQFVKDTQQEDFKKMACKAWGTEWTFFYIGWNMDGSNPFFTDKKVRYAMTHALNLPKVIDEVLYNLAQPCLGVYHPESWMFNPEITPLHYDRDRAAALLDEAGWRVDPEDGWRSKTIDGEKIRFSFTLLIVQGKPIREKIALIYKSDLRQLGVELKLQVMEWAALQEKTNKHEYQANLGGWGTGAYPDTGSNIWKTDQYHDGRNFNGYSNERVDELFDLATITYGQEARKKVFQEIHKIIYEDQPYTFMYYRPSLAAFNNRIRGVSFSPRGLISFDPGLGDWWVPMSAAQ